MQSTAQTRGWFVILAVAVSSLAACGSDPDSDADPVIPPLAVDDCERDEQCDEPLLCMCGRCTIPCGTDVACPQEEPALACYRTESELLGDRCNGLRPDQYRGVCLQTCDDEAACADDQHCRNGACVPQLNRAGEPATSGRPPGADADAGASVGADAG